MKADIIMEQRAIPLKRELKIIEEMRSLISLADERIAAVNQEAVGIQSQIDALNKEVEEIKKKNEGMPEAFQHLSDLVISANQEEVKPLEQALSAKKRAIALIQSNIKKKLDANYTDTKECLTTLAKKRSEIIRQIALLQQERDTLIEEFKSQYRQQKTQLQSIPKLVKALCKNILENCSE